MSQYRNQAYDINQKRKSLYQGIAAKNGTPVHAVELMAGKKQAKKRHRGSLFVANQVRGLKSRVEHIRQDRHGKMQVPGLPETMAQR